VKLVILHGAPGVGKLTVARELHKLTGFPVFHNHLTVDMLAAVFDFHSQAFIELREEFWLRVITRAVAERLPGLIFTFVFEPTVLPGFYDRLKAGVEPLGATLYPFELRCELEENARRIVQEDRSRYLKMTSIDFLRSSVRRGDYDPQHELPGNVVIDTTTLPAAETARLIADHLDTKRPA